MLAKPNQQDLMFDEISKEFDEMVICLNVGQTEPNAIGSGWFQRALASRGDDVTATAGGRLPGRKENVENLWRQFFSDPSQWWDHRAEKSNARYPDFKHKRTEEALWLNNKSNPKWVEAELAIMTPGTIQQNPFPWNTILTRCAKDGQHEKTLELFQQMQHRGIYPDRYTFVPVLNACASLAALEEGRCLHAQVIQSGCESDVFVGTSLVDMYAKCGSIEDALKVFNKMPVHNVVSWTAMIGGYVKCGEGQKALELAWQMEGKQVQPNHVTFIAVLNACASVAALEEGKRVHAEIVKRGLELDAFLGSSLIDMYAKCGSIEDAWKVFDIIPLRTIVSWNAMILGFVKCAQGQKALELYRQLQGERVEPNLVTFLGALNACAGVAALEEGRHVHGQIIECGHESDLFVGSSLVDMYAKCGSISEARRVFDNMPSRTGVSWSAMLGGYAIHGYAEEAFELYEQMCREGSEMDRITFVCLLSACSHAGLVEQGLKCFESMKSVHRIPATVEHYACMVDLLGRAGRLQEAENLIKTMSCQPSASVWSSLLGACRVHGDLEMGERVARQVLDLDPGDTSGYVTLSNIYAAAGKWGSRARVQQMMMDRGLKKQGGDTWIELNKQVHSFVVNDQVHPQISRIHAELKRLSGLMAKAEYVPETHLCYMMQAKEKDSSLVA